ncbi:thermonuclease family protein [Vampirovibrio chlorellavorus]|uniref:thermonuclease family protein n=1 Tax=Vampirovibrio chlorellavorus TaxID=758823 RepID=UPI003FCD969B
MSFPRLKLQAEQPLRISRPKGVVVVLSKIFKYGSAAISGRSKSLRVLKALPVISLSLVLSLPAMAERFVSCHDGDTCRLEDGLRVRFSGIDTPEIGQPFSESARDAMIQLVVDQESTLVCEGWSYNRRVCSVFVNGQDVQRQLVEQGLAYDYTQYSGGKYQQAEQAAKQNQVGVWALPDGGVRPWDYRHQQRKHPVYRNDQGANQ